MASGGKVYSRLVEGDHLEIGGIYGSPGRLEVKESAPGLKDASALFQGDLEALRDTTLGTAGTPSSLRVHAETSFQRELIVFRSGPLPADPITVQVDPQTGEITALQLIVGGFSIPALAPRYTDRAIDLVAHAVPGQANTYYIDKGATSHGFNAQIHPITGDVQVEVYILGQKQLQGVQYNVVRSLSSGAEGFAAVGSLNALQFTFAIPPGTVVWLDYHRASAAGA